ncbi:MAG: hypothetical protein C4321_07275 [Chloroflexota bacterium]
MLVNGRATVAIDQTDAQREAEEAQVARAMDGRTDARRLSDTLKEDIATVLTSEEREALENKQDITIPVERLSPEGRLRALQYIDLRWSQISSATHDQRLLDKTKPLRLNMQPGAWLGIGVDAYLNDGTLIHF